MSKLDMGLIALSGVVYKIKSTGPSTVSIEMSVMGVINISRQFFSTLVGMRSRSHNFENELKVIFLISSSVARSKPFI